MADLGANDEQLEFAMEHVVYASAMNGFARLDSADDNADMDRLLDMILDDMPAPEVDPDGPLAMQCVTIDHPSTSDASASAACIPVPSIRAIPSSS